MPDPMPPAAIPPLTDAEIANLRKLHEAGTAPPWGWSADAREVQGPPGSRAVEEWEDSTTPRDRCKVIVETDSGVYGPHDGDRELIPAARNALPRLLDFHERTRKLLLAEEWAEEEGGWKCPTCRGYKPGTGQQDREWVKRLHPEKLAQLAADNPPGHKTGCERAALLGLRET